MATTTTLYTAGETHYVWLLKAAFVDVIDDINCYVIITDVVDLKTLKVYRYYVPLIPSLCLHGKWCAPQMDFGTYCDNAPYFLNFFCQLRTNFTEIWMIKKII